MKVHAVWAIAMLVTVAGSFYSGTRVGVYEFQKFDAQYKASILAHQIIALQGPKRKDIIDGMEVSLNGELSNHGKYIESPLKWLWRTPDRDDRPIEFAVKYRIENPFSDPDVSDPSKWRNKEQFSKEELEHFAAELRAGQKENERLMRLVLDRYAP